MSYKGSKILITGGLGFIGSNLAMQLVELGADVTIVDSLIPEYGGNLRNIEKIQSKVRINISDIRDQHSLRYLVQGKDVLFNLAGQTSHVDSMCNPVVDLEINAIAQLSVLEAARIYNPEIKIVFASTRQIYGAPQYLPVDEKHPICPVDVNGINKTAGEWYHLLYNRVYGIRATVLRLTNTYGPRMRVRDARQTFLGIWIQNVLQGLPISVFGDGNQIRDFTFIDDVVEAMLICGISDKAYGEVFNLGGRDPMKLIDVAKLLIKLNGRGSYQVIPFPRERQIIDIGDYFGDYKKARDLLNWNPSVLVQDGLSRTLSYYQEYGQHYWGKQL
jgi:UDP-glucose 4-epimerase